MATAVQYRKWLLVAALSWALLGCFQGLAIDKLANKRMGKAAYHLLRHFSELLIGCALAFPYATALSEKMQKVCFVCLQIAPLSNFLSYMVIAITDCPNELFKNSPELVKAGTGAGNIWTTISTLGLTVVTSSVVVIGLLSLIYGIAKADSDDDVSSSGSKTRGKTPMKKKL